jgi:NAD(P)-dependent dehydrogenase (short-subunit alcohol dehydrogenase family)
MRCIPLGRTQLAEDAAGMAMFLASDASGDITGQTLQAMAA